MKKRIILSCIIEDENTEIEELTNKTKSMLGEALRNCGGTHVTIFPGVDSNEGQEFVVNFPPVWIDTSDYNNWETNT